MAYRSVQEMREELTHMAAEFLDDDDIDRWFELIPHPGLGGRTPLQVLEQDGEDGFEKVKDFIDAISHGTYG